MSEPAAVDQKRPSATASPPAGEGSLHERNLAAIRTAPPVRMSPWTRRQKIIRLLWSTFGRAAWTLLPSARAAVLRCFGATVGSGCRFARTVDILIPWNLTIGDRVDVGDRVILYALGPVHIGSRTVLDTRSHICAGSHDVADPSFRQTRPAIEIGADCLIGVDAFISPGVVLGDHCVVHPRASVYKSAKAGKVLRGNPAWPVDPEDE